MENIPKHPADVADQLQRLPAEKARAELDKLPHETAAAVLHEIEHDERAAILSQLETPQVAKLLHELPHDEAVDVISALPGDRRSAVLSQLPFDQQQHIKGLLKYAPDTAGGIMSDQFLSVRAHQTVDQTLQELRKRVETVASGAISYLYVVNENSTMVGIVSIRDLVFSRPERRISEIMNRDVKHVWVDDDQEKIAHLFEHYHYLALPVLERNGQLVGIVVANQVINVLRKEATEDMQLMVGLSGEERALTPWRKSIGRRLPWLCINLATAFLAGAVVGLFEDTIASWTALAIFLPIVAGQGGNAGAQTLTIIIRDLALGELSPGDGRKALIKELILGLLNGLVIGLIVAVVGYLWKANAMLGVVVGLAMLLNMVAAALSGVLVPYTMKALRIDPALASTILVTTVTDVAGFFFFLGLAALALSAQ